MSNAQSLSVVVATRNSAINLDLTLSAILASDFPRSDYELIVVDDSSSDGSAKIAARYADTVVRLSGRSGGPAYARNRGGELARGDVVAFVDADVNVRVDTLSRMVGVLVEDPDIHAVSASLDGASSSDNFLSQYWSLLLLFGESREAANSISHFATGCAAIRRDVLVASGMYDEWRFDRPSLEVLEFGQRLGLTGHRVLQSKTIRVSRSQRWNFRSVCREVWHRSVQLSRSLGYQKVNRSAPGEVVLTLSRPLVPALAVLGIVALSAAFGPHSHWGPKTLLLGAGLLLNNLPVQRFYARQRGLLFAVSAAPIHILMQSISGAALFTGWILREAFGDRLPDAATQAYSEVGAEIWPPVPRRI